MNCSSSLNISLDGTNSAKPGEEKGADNVLGSLGRIQLKGWVWCVSRIKEELDGLLKCEWQKFILLRGFLRIEINSWRSLKFSTFYLFQEHRLFTWGIFPPSASTLSILLICNLANFIFIYMRLILPFFCFKVPEERKHILLILHNV